MTKTATNQSKTATDQNGLDQNDHMRNIEVNVRNSFLSTCYTCGETLSATCDNKSAQSNLGRRPCRGGL